MIKLRSQTAATEPVLSTSLTVLAVSWLNARFTALAVHRGAVTGRWVCSAETSEAISELPRLLKEAVAQTGYQGVTVQMVLAHPRLNQLWLEVPETGGLAVQRFLQRQVQQGKSFDGPAAFSSQPTLPSKLSKGLLLHLFPQDVIDQLGKLAESVGLILTSVLPLAAVAQRQLSQLKVADNDVAVLAVECGGQTILVVGRSTGELCLARTLNEGWARNPARFAAEVNRTIHFVNQQFALNPGGVWLLGAIAPDRLAQLRLEFPLPVEISPVAAADDLWVNELLQCPATHPANLMPRERQAEPKRRRLLFVTLVVVSIMVLAAAATAVRFRFLNQAEQKNGEKLRQNVVELERRFRELTLRQTDLTNYQAFIQEAVDGRPPPVPAWFLGHLSDAAGNELVVTNLVVGAAGDHWQMSMSGFLPPTRGGADTNRLGPALRSLTNQLNKGPFHVRFGTNAAPDTSKVGTLNALSQYWTKRGTVLAAHGVESREFRMEGRFP